MFLTCFSADSKSFIIFALEYLFPRPGLSLFTSFSLFSFSAARDRCADFFFRLSRFLSVSACWKGEKSVVRTMKSGSRNEVMKNSMKYFKFCYSFAVFMLWHVLYIAYFFWSPNFFSSWLVDDFLRGQEVGVRHCHWSDLLHGQGGGVSHDLYFGLTLKFWRGRIVILGEKKASTLGFDRFARDQAVKMIECPYLHLWGVVEVCESVQFGKEESHGLSDVFNLRWNLVVTFPVKHAYKTSAESGRLIIGHLQVVYIVQDVQ